MNRAYGYSHRLRVRYSETDQMGVVYHTNYLNWFEVGRTEYIRSTGFAYRELEKRGMLLPATEAALSFRAPARYDDEVEVRTWIKELTPVRLEFGYEIVRPADNAVLVTGWTRHVFVSHEWKPIRLPRVMPDVYQVLEREFELWKQHQAT